MFDGFALRNGATVTVVVIVYTNAEGVIATEFLGCTPPGVDSSGPACAAKIVDLLEERLGVQTGAMACVNSSGLPTSQPRRGGFSEVKRSALLTCILGRLGTRQTKK